MSSRERLGHLTAIAVLDTNKKDALHSKLRTSCRGKRGKTTQGHQSSREPRVTTAFPSLLLSGSARVHLCLRSIDVRIGAEILEDFLAALLVDHQVNAVAAMASLQALLGLDEILVIPLPVAISAALADLFEVLLPVLAEALQQLVLQRQQELTAARIALATAAAEQLAIDAQRLVPLRAEHVQPARVDHFLGRLDVGATTGHVGCDRHLALLSCERNDLRLLLMEARVEDLMVHASLGEAPAQLFRLLHRACTDQHWPPQRLQALHLAHDGVELDVLVGERAIGPLLTDDRAVGRHAHHPQLVDTNDLPPVLRRGAGHAGELFVQAEVAL